jgi:hypothetical protein
MSLLNKIFGKEFSLVEVLMSVYLYATYSTYTTAMWIFFIALYLLVGYIKYNVRDF